MVESGFFFPQKRVASKELDYQNILMKENRENQKTGGGLYQDLLNV